MTDLAAARHILDTLIGFDTTSRHSNLALIEWVERGFLASGPRASETLAGLATLDQRELLSSFSFPVLSIGGTKDTIADPAIAGYAADCAKDGTLLTLNTGHSPQLEAPTIYNDAILAFIGKLA